ncbi:Non-structural maintenance of chromosomes element 4 [Plasmodiophora brassicae]
MDQEDRGRQPDGQAGRRRRSERQDRERARRRLLGDSTKQTDAERIVVRQDLRALVKRTKESRAAIFAGDASVLEELHAQHDAIHERVLHPSEANIEAKELSLMASLTAESTRLMAEKFSLVSVDDFIARIASEFSMDMADDDDEDVRERGASIDWVRLGKDGSNCLVSVRTCDFMPGLLTMDTAGAEPAEKTRARKRRREAPDTDAVHVDRVEAPATTLVQTQTDARVATLHKILKSAPTGYPFFRLIVNPVSFGQTVENLFDLSFLVGSGHAQIQVDDDGELRVTYQTPPDNEELKSGHVPTQSIVQMDMRLWEEVKRVYDIKESLIPTRPNDIV